MQSEVAKKNDEDEKNVFEKLISDENGYVSLFSNRIVSFINISVNVFVILLTDITVTLI